MDFTDEERRAWREDRRRREHQPEQPLQKTAAAICLHCQNPFGFGKGVITDDDALCDICLGDKTGHIDRRSTSEASGVDATPAAMLASHSSA